MADKPPRTIELDRETEVALKASVARIFGDVFEEEDVAYFSFSGFIEFIQGAGGPPAQPKGAGPPPRLPELGCHHPVADH